MAYFENHGSGLHRLIYVSRSLRPPGPEADAEIADIVLRSAEKNRALAVTGALLIYNGRFIQALEGSYDTLKPLYERIADDPRHTEVRLKAVTARPGAPVQPLGHEAGPQARRGLGRGVRHGRPPRPRTS